MRQTLNFLKCSVGPTKVEFPNRDTLIQPMIRISYLSTCSKDATNADGLYLAYHEIQKLAENGINLFKEDSMPVNTQKAETIKEVEIILGDEDKISDLEEKLKVKDDVLQKLAEELIEARKVIEEHELHCPSIKQELLRKTQEVKEESQNQIISLTANYESKSHLQQEELSKKVEELSVARQILYELEQKTADLNAGLQKLKKEILFDRPEKLEFQNTAQILEMKKKLEENEKQKQNYEEKMNELVGQLDGLKKEVKKLSMFEYKNEIDPEIPFISIRSSSLFPLQSNGWLVNYHKEETLKKLQKQKTPIVGLLGPQSAGKSWLANLLNDGGLPFGPSANDDSLTAFFSQCQKNGNRVCFLVSRGHDKLSSVNLTPQGLESLSMKPTNRGTDEESFFYKLQLICEDSKITKELEENFIIQQSNLLLYVANELTQTDLEKICTINRKRRELQQNSKCAPNLIVVHNLKLFKTIQQVEEYVSSIKNKGFRFAAEPLFTIEEATQKLSGKFAKLFKDEFGIAHLIIAQSHSKAGDYYNEGPALFLRSKLVIEENKKAWDFTTAFVDFCNKHLSALANSEIRVKFDNSTPETKIVATENSKIRPDLLFCNLGGNPFGSNDFEPHYSIEVSRNGEEQIYSVFVELLDSKFEQPSLKCHNGQWHLIILGERSEIVIEDKESRGPNISVENLKGTREAGTFRVVIPLAKNMKTQSKEPVTKDVGSGIWKFTCQFEPEKEEFF